MKVANCLISYLASISLLTACGCSSSSSGITVIGDNNTEYNSYEEACHAQDYEAAHKYLVAMKKAKASDYSEAREYVFNQEALFLIALNDEASTKRLFFLLQEDANEVNNETRDTRCNTIVELAIKQDNKTLVEQTIGLYSGQIDKSVLQKIYNYLFSEDKEPDIDFMINILKKNKGINIMVSDAIKRQDDAMLMHIIKNNGCDGAQDATSAIAKYIIGKKDKKLLASCLSLLRKNNQWNAVLDMGVAMNDLTMIKQSYQNIDDKDDAFDRIVPILSTSNNNAIKQYLFSIATNEGRARKLIETCLKNDHPDIILKLTKKYSSQFSESFLDEIMDYAISKNGGDFTNLVITILTSTPITGHPLPAGQRMTSNRPQEVVDSHNEYVSSVKAFNSKCDHILNAAISQHKGSLAKKIVTLYKDVPIDYVVNEHWWQIAKTCVFSSDDKKRAQNELQQAKKRGDI